MFETQDTLLVVALEKYRGKIDSMAYELLRAFLYEYYAHMQDISLAIMLTDFTLNISTHFRSDIFKADAECRNDSTRLRYQHQQLFR